MSSRSDGAQLDFPVFDGHNDTLLRIAHRDPDDEWSFGRRNDDGALDLVRAREGGMIGGLFAIMAPPGTGDDAFNRAKLVQTDDGYRKPMAPRLPRRTAADFARELIGLARALESTHADRFFVAESFDQLRNNDDRLAAVIHFEGAEPIDEQLDNLEAFYELGLRSLGLVWSRPNAFGSGVPFRFPSSPDVGPGLTDAGKRLVDACNRLGIVVDCAHLNEAGFWDVEQRTEAPIVVSHACCHAISPSARNLTDRQIDAVGASGGIVGINFFVADLREDGAFDTDTPLEQLVRHIDYAVDRIGIDHVGFGSDFDGARMPKELADASRFPVLLQKLRDAGYGDDELRKLARDNWFRILRKTWADTSEHATG